MAALRSPSGDDVELRKELRSRAQDRLASALKAGYYIEAVALEDSMISDRLEELLDLRKEHVAMNSLGQLAQLARAMDPEAFSALAQRLLAWADQRNQVVHQMVKVGPTHRGDWESRLAAAQAAAVEGQTLAADVERTVAEYAATRGDDGHPHASAGVRGR